MNPWSFYEHKPQLMQTLLVALVAWTAARGAPAQGSRVRILAWTALTWAAVGLLNYLVYAFGYQLAKWGRDEIAGVQHALEWLRVIVLLFGVIAAATSQPTKDAAPSAR
jgi:hypothetical protein